MHGLARCKSCTWAFLCVTRAQSNVLPCKQIAAHHWELIVNKRSILLQWLKTCTLGSPVQLSSVTIRITGLFFAAHTCSFEDAAAVNGSWLAPDTIWVAITAQMIMLVMKKLVNGLQMILFASTGIPVHNATELEAGDTITKTGKQNWRQSESNCAWIQNCRLSVLENACRLYQTWFWILLADNLQPWGQIFRYTRCAFVPKSAIWMHAFEDMHAFKCVAEMNKQCNSLMACAGSRYKALVQVLLVPPWNASFSCN